MIQSVLTTASKARVAIAFTAFALILSAGTSAHGDEFNRIDNMAKKIQKKSKLLLKETTRYRHTAQYASLIDCTTHLHDAAIHIQQVLYFANNLNHLQSDLAELDRNFHQLEGLFAATEDSASRGRGHVHGNTAYARGLLRSIEVSIDLMRKDVRKLQSRSLSQHHQVHRATTQVPYSAVGYNRGRHVPAKPAYHKAVKQKRPTYHQQPRQANGFSFSIGGGSSRIHFNF